LGKIKVDFKFKYHFPEDVLESVSKMQEMIMEPREIVEEYDKRFKATQRGLQELMTKKYKLE